MRPAPPQIWFIRLLLSLSLTNCIEENFVRCEFVPVAARVFKFRDALVKVFTPSVYKNAIK